MKQPMTCPRDGSELKVANRQGVEIDYCPSCRGVWLDRGELDKIIEAAYALPSTAPAGQEPPTVGVWADSISPAVAPQASAPDIQAPAWPPPPLQQTPHAPPSAPQNAPSTPNIADAIVPAIGGLIAGLAASNLGRQQYGYGHKGRKNRKPRGWLEQIFDIDD